MWSNLAGNIKGAVGKAIQNVQKMQNELESQLDAAVGADGEPVIITSKEKIDKSENSGKIIIDILNFV